MIKKVCACIVTCFIAAFFIQQANAADLLQVYKQAVKSDPTFKAALAAEMSAAEAEPQNLAALLPQLSFVGYGRLVGEKQKTSPPNILALRGLFTGAKSRGYDVALSLKQSVFNAKNWASLCAAKNSVKAARATYNAAEQDLMIRTTSAYFAVLQAQEILRYDIANKKALYQQYIQALQGYKVGVKTITDVYQGRSDYETSVSVYITDKNNLANKLEDLRAITGVLYKRLAPLKTKIPTISPRPANINRWADTGIKHNWKLIATYYSTLEAHDKIRAAQAGHLPTLDFSAQYRNDYLRNFGGRGAQRTMGPSARMDLDFPIFQGGAINSQVRQSIADYKNTSAQEEATYRDVVNGTRQAYLGVMSGISTIDANRRAVIFNQSALQGTQEGYKIGTQTMVDVLIALQKLYNAQKSYVNSRYDYINSLLALKEKAGTLSAVDIMLVNNWLQPRSSLVLNNHEYNNSPKLGRINGVLKQEVKQQSNHNKTKISSSGNKDNKPSRYLQVGAYRSELHAKNMLNVVRNEILTHCAIYPVKHGKKALYFVRLGPLQQKESINGLIKKLHALGIEKPEII